MNVVLERSYHEYMNGFTDKETGAARRGFIDVVKELTERFPNPGEIVKDEEKKEFAKLFGEYLRLENMLRNYDEFSALKAFQRLDSTDTDAVEEFKRKHYLNDDDLCELEAIDMPSERAIQDYCSTYNDIRDWLRREKESPDREQSDIDWDDVVFEVDLLNSQEINLDYILELIFEKNKKVKNKEDLIDDARRVIRSSLGNRAKESLIVDFINQTDLDLINDKVGVIEAFFSFAQDEQRREVEELIRSENLNSEAAKRYISVSIRREFASESGEDLNDMLPKMSPLNPQFRTKKTTVFERISSLVEKFKGVGGQV